jgi:hypothetical protein
VVAERERHDTDSVLAEESTSPVAIANCKRRWSRCWRASKRSSSRMHAVRKDPELKRFYRPKLIQKGMGNAWIAAARKLGIPLWIMVRDQIDYEEFCRRGRLRQSGEAHAGMPDL